MNRIEIELFIKRLVNRKIRRSFANIITCFVSDKNKRENIRKKIKDIRLTPSDILKLQKGTPIEPWTFIRVRNEIVTIDSCLKSILPAIKKGVIGYNDCDDGSEEYILEFCRQNPGFIPIKYPYSVRPPYFLDKLGEEEEEKNSFTAYSNYVLSCIPENEWIIKIDCDHIYNAEKLKQLFYIPKDENDCIIISKLNLHYDTKINKLYAFKGVELNEATDHWILKNKNLKFEHFYNMKFKDIDGKRKIIKQEELDVSAKRIIFTELVNYHFPLVKNYREVIHYNKLLEFNEYKKIAPVGTKIDDKMLDENKIIDICKKFNWERKRILP